MKTLHVRSHKIPRNNKITKSTDSEVNLSLNSNSFYTTSNILATWSEELTHWERPWCWERLQAGGEGDDRGWDGWTASPTWWTWVWVSSGSWWWTGKPAMLQSMGSQRVRHDWVTELTLHKALVTLCLDSPIHKISIILLTSTIHYF